MKSKLASQEVELAQKNEDANKLIAVVGAESEKVGKEKDIANEEEKKVKVINDEVAVKAAECSRDLAKAEPALLAAQEALNTLNKVIKHMHNRIFNVDNAVLLYIELSRNNSFYYIIFVKILKILKFLCKIIGEYLFSEQSDRVEVFWFSTQCCSECNSRCNGVASEQSCQDS